MSGDAVSQWVGSLLYGNVQIYLAVALALLVLLWLTALVWVLKDSMARSNSLWFHLLSVILVTLLTPVFGLPLYLAIRPIYYHPRKYFGRNLLYALTVPCPQCQTINDKNNYYCTCCGRDLSHQCDFCGTYFAVGDDFCYHCGRSAHEKKWVGEQTPKRETRQKKTA